MAETMQRVFYSLIVVTGLFLAPSISLADALPGSLVRVYNQDHTFLREWYAYDEQLTIGVNAVVADVTGDTIVPVSYLD